MFSHSSLVSCLVVLSTIAFILFQNHIMEFPHLGKHCSEKSCNKLDFLPMKCDACNNIFCSDHFTYIHHACLSAHKNDVQVPVCPLCGNPVSTPRGVSPDQTVGEHIDRYCKSETKKIFTNRCTYKNCRKKELVPFLCSVCQMNFCIRHRHSTDHECEGRRKAQQNLMAKAAESRIRSNTSVSRSENNIETIQGNMSEDEALAKALALSIMELDESADRNRRNQGRIVRVGGEDHSTQNNNKCTLS